MPQKTLAIQFVTFTFALGVGSIEAGDLNPPAGPVAPTMKTLTQVEPRIDVQSVPGNSNWRHVITQPGSYYLSGNVLGPSEPGPGPAIGAIRIDTSHVTLDLNGFALIGAGPLASTAIFSSGDNITIRNGTIDEWALGVALEGDRCRIENVRIIGSTVDGIELLGSDGTIDGCTIVGSGFEGIQLAQKAHGTTVRGCKLRNNTRHQILVETDGNTIEDCSLVAEAGVTQPALAISGVTNILRNSTITLGEPAQRAIELSGDGNRLLTNAVRLTSTAVSSEGVFVTGNFNHIEGGSVLVESAEATAVHPQLVVIAIIAILIGLQEGADGSTGILAGGPAFIEQDNIYVHSANSIGIDIQGGAGNVGARVSQSQVQVSGAGSIGIRTNASASIIQMSGLAQGPGASDAIQVVAGSPGGHSIVGNDIVLAGGGQSGGMVNGPTNLVRENNILVRNATATAINQFSGANGMISDNTIRLAVSGATGITAGGSSNLLTKNVVTGTGNRFNVGASNSTARIIVNPESAFNWPDNLNYEVGP